MKTLTINCFNGILNCIILLLLVGFSSFAQEVVYFNAKSEINSFETDPYACWDIADATLAAYQAASLKFKRIDTTEDEDEIWNTAYDNCMN